MPNCYCNLREKNPEFFKPEIPLGYCGLCDFCGQPGHTHAHPKLPTTGNWCEQHWQEQLKGNIISLGEIIQYLFLGLLLVIIIFQIYRFFY